MGPKLCLLPALVIAAAGIFAAPAAIAAPPAAAITPAVTGSATLLQDVRYRGGRHGGWRGGRGWGGVGAGIIGGAILGSALAAPYYYGRGYGYGPSRYYYEDYDAPTYYRYRSRESADSYCSRRFKSYDPDSGTYMGYDGIRHSCP